MVDSTASAVIQFFSGLNEELSGVSLRRSNRTGERTVLMTFEKLQALERLNSFTHASTNTMRLLDVEGEIEVEPSSVQFRFGGEEGDQLQRMDCRFEISDEHWDRFMRFMNRYAEANGLSYRGSTPEGTSQ
ncbi:photosystem II reaction center protein Psb28 [Leptolyngbya sp. FACHB-261]|uniref:photosystem II reaction center protein Psb28 n=1 Tax=Leptolyngbya sp. FACHB-261 TaxID=2692806 RepID=UPI001683F399|nr:photosystem II reaction center protein Psb28 [Leptolyngbya sp. FACHB-261]MBD2104622.1 photosystem II reaction center protein Psb28 [Leptolyngbya sp. FACHB-261]